MPRERDETTLTHPSNQVLPQTRREPQNANHLSKVLYMSGITRFYGCKTMSQHLLDVRECSVCCTPPIITQLLVYATGILVFIIRFP